MFVLAPGAADIENTPALFIAYLTVLFLSFLLTTDNSPHVFGPGWEQQLNFICIYYSVLKECSSMWYPIVQLSFLLTPFLQIGPS